MHSNKNQNTKPNAQRDFFNSLNKTEQTKSEIHPSSSNTTSNPPAKNFKPTDPTTSEYDKELLVSDTKFIQAKNLKAYCQKDQENIKVKLN
jgi:hypothetical protein